METIQVFNLEEIIDKRKFASLDVTIHYGDWLLDEANLISKYIQSAIDYLSKEKQSFKVKGVLTSLKDAQLETRMIQIAVTDMKDYINGYRAYMKQKQKQKPVEEISADEDWGFTPEELEKIKKYREEGVVPEEGSRIRKVTPEELEEI